MAAPFRGSWGPRQGAINPSYVAVTRQLLETNEAVNGVPREQRKLKLGKWVGVRFGGIETVRIRERSTLPAGSLIGRTGWRYPCAIRAVQFGTASTGICRADRFHLER